MVDPGAMMFPGEELVQKQALVRDLLSSSGARSLRSDRALTRARSLRSDRALARTWLLRSDRTACMRGNYATVELDRAVTWAVMAAWLDGEAVVLEDQPWSQT
ncbi:hypothetical protein DY000_02014498 [Brassica cretica]|uniref:Uncharacterized protein n=1 Tax=Brassica cretica TaxID=69181 RepID=A0ABQ7CTZ7_BRACR|nr:hypothetical protein DY000_02014498 [Brassica cretica]